MKIFDFFKKCATIIHEEKRDREIKYDFISHEENFERTGYIYGKIRVKGTGKIFYKPIYELYKKEWLNEFSREDGAFIAVLSVAEQQKDLSIITFFPRKKKKITKHVVLLGMLFISSLILSNLTGFKIVEFNLNLFYLLPFMGTMKIDFPAALIFFPMTYFFDDTLTEVYGFQISRFIIWCGLICMTLVMLGIFVSVHLIPSSFWPYQNEYSMIFGSTFRIFFASALGYFVGEICNSTILSKIKVLTSGRWLWLRIISSTSIAVLIDSIMFCHIAFFKTIPEDVIWKMVLTQYIFKVLYEIMALPLTYLIIGYLKKKDQVDYYDYQTNFNPFSLKVD